MPMDDSKATSAAAAIRTHPPTTLRSAGRRIRRHRHRRRRTNMVMSAILAGSRVLSVLGGGGGGGAGNMLPGTTAAAAAAMGAAIPAAFRAARWSESGSAAPRLHVLQSGSRLVHGGFVTPFPAGASAARSNLLGVRPSVAGSTGRIPRQTTSPTLLLSSSRRGGDGDPQSSTSTSYSTKAPQRPRQLQSQQTLQSIPYDIDIENALTASGYKRPTVNWYPGHIAKAERLLSETLKSVDVVVEVRDSRAPKATAHPRVAEWAAGRPRVVVLTHVDSIPEGSRVRWSRSYDEFGAGRWDGKVDKQVTNKARQGRAERDKYGAGGGGGTKENKNKQGGGGEMDAAVSGVADVLFVDAKRGSGIHSINRSILRAGSHVNERRSRRGLADRPLRVGVIGYPNVGKSALINKILGRRRARTADTPGITKSLQWIRVRTDDAKKSRGKEFELLDSPGIIPANMVDQSDALLLAACNSVGTAAYDNQAVAAYLCEWLKTLHLMGRGELTAPKWRKECLNRYGFDPLVAPLPPPPPSTAGDGGAAGGNAAASGRLLTGEDMVFKVADVSCRGSPEDAARKILQDFRAGRMGPISLQLAPERPDDEGQVKVDVRRGVAAVGGMGEGLVVAREEQERMEGEERGRRARAAVETARERGLELPPMVEQKAASSDGNDVDDADNESEESSDETPPKEEEIGKGVFDGW